MRHLVAVASALLVACNAGDPDKDQPLFTVSVQSPAGGTFTAVHQNALGAGGGSNETFTGNGAFREVIRIAHSSRVDTSLQEIRGTFTGQSLVVGFGTRLVSGAPGSDVGAQSGSPQSTAGPQPQSSSCQVRYGPGAAGGSTYRVTFRFTADRARICAAP